MDICRPYPIELDAGGAVRRANGFGVRGLELADHPVPVGGDVAADPACAVSFETSVQALSDPSILFIGYWNFVSVFNNEMNHDNPPSFEVNLRYDRGYERLRE